MRDGFDGTRSVAALALGYAGTIVPPVLPPISFEPGEGLRSLAAVPVDEEARPAVAAQLRDAFAWCAARFPLGIRDANGRRCPAVTGFSVGRSAHPGEFLTASSPQRTGTLFVAAPWPVPSRYRLASLIAHEAMHQALYNRERRGPVARLGSLGYSPWKAQLRPGRLVWHAFWTFSTQFMLLVEALAERGATILAEDPEMPAFLAEMDARIACCADSLEAFDLLDATEFARTREALHLMTAKSACLLAGVAGYVRLRAEWQAAVASELEGWAELRLATPSDAALSLA